MKVRIQTENFREKLLWAIAVFMFASFYLFVLQSWGRYVLAGCTIVIYVFGVLLYRQFALRIEIGAFHLFLAAFALYAGLSVIWSIRPAKSVSGFKFLLQILLLYSLLMAYFRRFDSVTGMLDCIMWAGYVIALYTFIYYGGYRNIMVFINSAKRLEHAFANINTIGMMCAIACVIQFYKVIYTKKYLSSVFAIPAIIVMAATQTRKAIIFLVLGIIAIVVLKNFDLKKFGKSFLKGVISVTIAVALLSLLLKLELFAPVRERLNDIFAAVEGASSDSSTSTRFKYIEIGLEQFYEHPFLGTGIGTSNVVLSEKLGVDTYYHNNFVELLGCCGIAGFVVYYSAYVYLFYNLIRLRKYSKSEADICLILLAMLLIMDFGSVSYTGKAMYFYFMTFFVQVEILMRRKRKSDNELQQNNTFWI